MAKTKILKPKYLGKMLEPLDFFDPSDFEARQRHTEDLLCRYLNMKTVVAFIGAGLSLPLGYPSWNQFVKDIFFLLNITLSDEELLLDLFEEDLKKREKKFKENVKRVWRNNLTNGRNVFILRKYFRIFLKVLRKLVLDSIEKKEIKGRVELKELRNLFEKRKSEFKSLFEYANEGNNAELDALAIFSEWERLLSASDDENLSCSKKEWEIHHQSKFFRLVVKTYFKVKRRIANSKQKPKVEKEAFNPYLALLNLPIKKFVTFNYDLEIERALLYEKRIPHVREKADIYGEEIKCEDIIDLCKEKSFAQKSECCNELANFSVARYENVYHSVFHCHGRVDDTETCIVSEEDYQKWYLQSDPEKFLPFRQTLDLAIDSNPILFMGFGLKDADFMKLLRTITANRSTEKTRKPLFCLLYVGVDDIKETASNKKKKFYKWQKLKELKDECTALYMKYGLHVIPVRAKEDDWEKGDATCRKLLQLKDAWRNWWEGILQKPKFRKYEIEANPYYHYKFEIKNPIIGFDTNFKDKLDEALGFNEAGTLNKDKKSLFASRLAVVVGDGGTGKSWSVQSYLETKKDNLKKGDKIFYWSSYYVNDVLTGIDRLINYFTTHKEREKLPEYNKFDWLKKIVNEKDNSIIVFDGIEKLLNPNKENTKGESVSPEVKEFFKIISSGKVRCRIIITTRLFPTDILLNIEEKLKSFKEYEDKKLLSELELIPAEESPNNLQEYLFNLKTHIRREKIISAPKCWAENLKNDDSFKLVDIDNKKFISSICSLFEGHIFGISLMKGILEKLRKLKTDESEKFEKQINQITRDIANTPIEKRIERIIREAISTIDKRKAFSNFNKPANSFIQRIALFMHPVRKEIAQICFEEVKKRDLELWKYIEEQNRKKASFGEKYFSAFLNILVRSNLLQEVKIKERIDYVVHPLVRSYVFERLHESRFSSFPSLQLPGFTSGKEVVDPGSKDGKRVAADLFKALCEQSKIFYKKRPAMQKEIASDMCRGAFSVLRSRFCSNTVARWGSYTDYTKMTLLLYDTAKEVSKKHWDYVEPTRFGFDACSKPSGPLYPDELAWVYNEVGLASQSMGNNLNATALWEQGFEISKLIDRDKEGRYLFQSNINLGAIYIYYGKLDMARNYLNKAFEIANKLDNKKLSARVAGYIALVKYLRGSLEEADIEFTEACNGLSENARARAVFMNFHGELLLKLNRAEEALEKIEQSRHIAESDYYPDLIAYSRLSKGNYFSQIGEYIQAQNEYQFVLKTSKDIHLRRLEAATLSGMSRLADKLGDSSTAVRLATDSLKISNEYLLSLHQTQGLIVLGKALINGHQHRNLGIACLQTARDLAQRQEYFLRMNQAKEELAKHNLR